MKEKEIDLFIKVNSQLESIYLEVSQLSKKTPTDGVNSFKLKLINKTIQEANGLLQTKYKPYPDFEVFNEDDVPSNSDVAFIVSQYLNCMEILRMDNVRYDDYDLKWVWLVNKELSDRNTYPPVKRKEK